MEMGETPQALIPGGTWQAATPAADEEVLVSCVVSPGFDFADFRSTGRSGADLVAGDDITGHQADKAEAREN